MISFAEQAAWSGLTYASIAVIPGPNFLLISLFGMNLPRAHALAGALGVAAGVAMLALLAALLPQALQAEPAVPLLRIAFAGLLWWLAFRALTWPGRQRAPGVGGPPRRPPASQWACLTSGFATALANPLTLAFFAGHAMVLPGGEGQARGIAMVAGIFAMALAWFALIATAASRPAMRRLAARHGPLIAICVGMLLAWWAFRASLALLG